MLRKVAEIVRQNARELAAIDAIDCGNPFTANYLPRLVRRSILLTTIQNSKIVNSDV